MDAADIAASLGVKLSTALAGLAGGVARVVFLGQSNPIGWKRAVGLVLMGALSAGYLTPLVMLAMPAPADGPVERAMGFVVGLLSMTLVELVLRFADWLREDPGRLLDLLRRRSGGGAP
ncbi:MAG: hypothetical protein KIT36_22035 [Alphaproteobacteria bacterium]|nr:hypothetical protein [Alphaproteobacteria bacterium]